METAKRKSRWPVVIGSAGAAALIAAGALGTASSKYYALALVIGVVGVIAIVSVVGAPLRRSGSPQGRTGLMIGTSALLAVAASLAMTLPPHSALIGTLLLIVSTGLFAIGVGILGGGMYGIIACVGAGLAGSALLLGPTPIALAHVGTTMTCQIRDYHNRAVGDFTADCPDGHHYSFLTKDWREFPDGRVAVIVDRHGLLQAQFVGQHRPTLDLVVSILSLLIAAGIVVAAALNRRRLRGQVPRVVIPRRSPL
jgi:hypothetical protein